MRAGRWAALSLAAVSTAGVFAQGGAQAADVAARQVRPSAIDSAVKAFDDPSVVISATGAPADRPLVLFLTGTGGKPANAADLLNVIAQQGYRVVGLEYDDEPAVQQVCPKLPDPTCAAAFRAMRVYGEADRASPVANPQAESVVARLTALLIALDRNFPDEGWGGYLKAGAPDWSRVVVSGLSQGAGMAAFIAKREAVARVVLFSSPWDWTGADRHPAPWLSQPSATPPDRWFAEYHRRELTADALRRAYAALRIPTDHIRVFDQDIPSAYARMTSPNPFHGLTIKDTRYAPDWREMFGRAY